MCCVKAEGSRLQLYGWVPLLLSLFLSAAVAGIDTQQEGRSAHVRARGSGHREQARGKQLERIEQEIARESESCRERKRARARYSEGERERKRARENSKR